ncbi:MAG TPA: ABC transporter ATP-binding protein, partial [Flavobacteriales bacterium]|nr:ABC transporter ATP-binding protein [Flavobacteriales bacterium]
TAGSVSIDGTDIRELRIKDLRALMGIVTQDSLLFNDTVAANIAFGRTGIGEDDIQRAAEIANAHEFISRLPNGYQTS